MRLQGEGRLASLSPANRCERQRRESRIAKRYSSSNSKMLYIDSNLLPLRLPMKFLRAAGCKKTASWAALVCGADNEKPAVAGWRGDYLADVAGAVGAEVAGTWMTIGALAC
ncbi:protein of unknown function [Cupriavidus neocaledonicus]|uniref:Uncharacterized protein n=1 Tax=Cupriavidus neocaledonicus TaxID=1040979 RepID=A0A375HB23_9BURK|nr:protein of unknown function [Cupriavidus neocaledonicus]